MRGALVLLPLLLAAAVVRGMLIIHKGDESHCETHYGQKQTKENCDVHCSERDARLEYVVTSEYYVGYPKLRARCIACDWPDNAVSWDVNQQKEGCYVDHCTAGTYKRIREGSTPELYHECVPCDDTNKFNAHYPYKYILASGDRQSHSCAMYCARGYYWAEGAFDGRGGCVLCPLCNGAVHPDCGSHGSWETATGTGECSAPTAAVAPTVFNGDLVRGLPRLEWDVAKVDGKECTGDGCTVYRVPQSYNDNVKYPPWFNCIGGPGPGAAVDTSDATVRSVRMLVDLLQDANAILYETEKSQSYLSSIGVSTEHTAPATLRRLIFNRYLTDYQHQWFDYATLPVYRTSTDVSVVAENHRLRTEFFFPFRYKAFSLALLPGFTCNAVECASSTSWPLQVRRGLFHCVPCSRTAHGNFFCKGRHACAVRTLAARVHDAEHADYYDPRQLATVAQKVQLTALLSKHREQAAALNLLDAARLLLLCLGLEFRASPVVQRATPVAAQDADSAEPVYVPLPAAALPSNGLSWEHDPGAWDFRMYSTESAVNWEQTTGTPSVDPTTGRSEMNIRECLEHDETDQVAYGQCSQHESLLTLKQGVLSAFNRTGGAILQAGHGMLLPVAAGQLLSESLLAWARHNRPLRDQYMQWLLTLPKHCAAGRQGSSVCRVTNAGRTITLFNPWVGGEFSVPLLCDVRRHEQGFVDVVDSAGNELCKPGGRYDDFYAHQVAACRGADGELAVTRIVPRSAGTNLCSLAPRRNETCGHAQGLLGGFAGAPAGTLYYPQPELPGAGQGGGIFVAPRLPVFRPALDGARGASLRDSVLKVHPQDIAGHHMRFVVTDSDILRVDELLLVGAETGTLTARVAEAKARAGVRHPRGADAGSWLLWDERSEHLQDVAHEPEISAGAQHWSCPIRQRIFLAGSNARFRPRLPSGRRAALLFAAHHSDSTLRVHSVQAPGAAAARVYANMRTANGFCVCQQTADGAADPWRQCRTSVQSVRDECSFLQTLASLHDAQWRTSAVQKLYGDTGGCVEQLDWPYTGGALRDGRNMTHTRGGAVSECNLLDRLPEFQFRYKHDALPAPQPAALSSARAQNTLELARGDCHLARVYAADAGEGLDFLAHACHAIPESVNSTHMQLRCSADASAAGGVYTKTLRRLSAAPASAAPGSNASASGGGVRQRPRAVRCAQCAAPPRFLDGSGAREIPPESSFGVPFHESAERVIAGTVRNQLARALCGPAARDCERLDRALNVSSWVPGAFWDAFLGRVGDLFTEAGLAAGGGLAAAPSALLPNRTLRASLEQADADAADAYASDELLWGVPWVWCTRREPVCETVCDRATGVCSEQCSFGDGANGSSGSSIESCEGTVDKAAWMDPATRGGACAAKFAELQATSELTAAVDVCNIDRSMSEFCQVLQAARNEIFSANCYAAGVCYQERFFYQPSVYSLTNQEFVRSTVQNFYVQISDAACPQRLLGTAQIIAQNAERLQHCYATSLQRIIDMLQDVRELADKVVRVAYYFFMLVATVLRFAVEAAIAFAVTSAEALAAELQRWFELWVKEMGAMWDAIGQMVYNLVMEGPVGAFLKTMLAAICAITNWVLDVFVLQGYCGLLQWLEVCTVPF